MRKIVGSLIATVGVLLIATMGIFGSHGVSVDSNITRYALQAVAGLVLTVVGGIMTMGPGSGE